MILSNVEIQKALNEGRLGIDPRPEPEQVSLPSGVCPYQTSSVDLRLGDEITFFKEGLALQIDLRLGKFSDLFGPNSASRSISNDQPYSLAPGRFVLSKTLEKVSFPIPTDGRTCLAGRVEGEEFLCTLRTVGAFYGPNGAFWILRDNHFGAYQSWPAARAPLSRFENLSVNCGRSCRSSISKRQSISKPDAAQRAEVIEILFPRQNRRHGHRIR